MRSWPSNMTRPETILPGGEGTSLRIDSANTDFPLPDSPTIPSVSPGPKSKLTPSTALTTPRWVKKYVRRSRTLMEAVSATSGLSGEHIGGVWKDFSLPLGCKCQDSNRAPQRALAVLGYLYEHSVRNARI